MVQFFATFLLFAGWATNQGFGQQIANKDVVKIGNKKLTGNKNKPYKYLLMSNKRKKKKEKESKK